MSVEAITWALNQPVKQSSAKFVLVVLANCASSATNRSYPSVAYLSEATGQNRKTVIANLRRLSDEGFIEDSGERQGRTRQIIAYKINLNRPKNGTLSNSSKNGTVAHNSTESGTVQRVPKTDAKGPKNDLKGSQKVPERVPKTGHGTVRNRHGTVNGTKSVSARKKPMPADFGISDEVRAWAEKRGYSDLERHLDYFIGKAEANGYRYANWDAAFKNAIRDDWAKVRSSGPNGRPRIAQNFSSKSYEGTPDDQLPEYLRG